VLVVLLRLDHDDRAAVADLLDVEAHQLCDGRRREPTLRDGAQKGGAWHRERRLAEGSRILPRHGASPGDVAHVRRPPLSQRLRLTVRRQRTTRGASSAGGERSMRVRVVGDEGEVPLKLPGSIVLIYAVPIDAPSSRVPSPSSTHSPWAGFVIASLLAGPVSTRRATPSPARMSFPAASVRISAKTNM